MRVLFTIALSFVGFFALSAHPDSLNTYRNLVFEGGGVRGIAYAGALSALEKRGTLQQIERVGGTSVGAITALLVALNYSADEIKTVLDDLDIGQFNDGRWFFVGGFTRLNRRWPMADEKARTIYISTEGITPRVRRMSEADKTKLFDSGKRAVLGIN